MKLGLKRLVETLNKDHENSKQFNFSLIFNKCLLRTKSILNIFHISYIYCIANNEERSKSLDISLMGPK